MTRVQTFLRSLHGKNIHVTGISGTEGSEMVLFLVKHKCPHLTVHDFSPRESIKKHFRLSHSGLEKEEREERFEKVINLPVTYHFQDEYLKDIPKADIIFVPQSWYLYKENEPLKEFEKQGKLMNLTKLYFALFPGKICAVTGSNGKTTTVNVVYQIFRLLENQGRQGMKGMKGIKGMKGGKGLKGLKGMQGRQGALNQKSSITVQGTLLNQKSSITVQGTQRRVFFTGNDRRMMQILSEIEEATKDDWLTIEVSNRQLRIDLERSPDIGVITNITRNHLNEYDSFEAYKSAKISLLKYQTADQTAVLNFDDKESRSIIEHGEKNVFGFSVEQKLHSGAYLDGNTLVIKHAEKMEELCKKDDLKIIGKHNIANILAASAAAFCAGIPIQAIRDAITSFGGVPQRMELIREVSGRKFFNDTASTAPESTLAAIESFETPCILIMGGGLKGGDYETLKSILPKRVKKLILLKSPIASEIRKNIEHMNIFETDLLKQAVDEAYKESTAGDSIVFSPGGEYFTYFQDTMPGYKNYRTFVQRL